MNILTIPKLGQHKPEITMAPLIDIVFLLLIFFMVTTVFPDNEGLVIEKPSSENTAKISRENIIIKLNKHGQLYFKDHLVNLEDIKRLLKEELITKPDSAVIIHADRRTTTESLIDVIDAAKSGGAKQLGIATDEKPAST